MTRDGLFQIFYRDGYAWLTVFSNNDSNQKIYPEDITGKLGLLGVPTVRQQRIMEIIDEARGIPQKLGEWPDGKKLAPEIKTDVSEDSMIAWITVRPEKQGGEPLNARMMEKKLEEDGIVFGIMREILETIVLKNIYNQAVKVAHGTAPVDGKPPEPEYFFVTDRLKPFKELEYQRIDLKELNFIQNKKKGELLAKLSPPVRPVDGKDVYGHILEAKAEKEAPAFQAGEGTVMSDDGKSIIAAIDGNVRLASVAVMVEPLVTVEDVDYSNGNMDFNGSIDIKGRISDGFTVRSAGDIQIGKSVCKVNIETGGDLILKAGISGNDEGILYCEGNLYARYIENARVICKGNIIVEEAIMHSSLKAGGDIILSGKRAEIFGGKVLASGSIRCKKLGSVNEPLTEINIGIDIETSELIENLETEIKKKNNAIDELDLKRRQLKSAVSKNEQQGELREKLLTAITQLENESKELNIKLSQQLRELHEIKRNIKIGKTSSLSVEQKIFGKVCVYFGQLRWDSPNKGTSRTILVVKQGKLIEKGA